MLTSIMGCSEHHLTKLRTALFLSRCRTVIATLWNYFIHNREVRTLRSSWSFNASIFEAPKMPMIQSARLPELRNEHQSFEQNPGGKTVDVTARNSKSPAA